MCFGKKTSINNICTATIQYTTLQNPLPFFFTCVRYSRTHTLNNEKKL